MHVKFGSNRIIFTIRSINLFFIHNLRLYKLEIKYLIDDMAIDFLFSWNFTSIEEIIRKYNLMLNLSKFTLKKRVK